MGRTQYESYEFFVMSSGLYDAPSTFTTLMSDIFQDQRNKYVVIFIYVTMFHTTKGHAKHLEWLAKLKEQNLHANEERCDYPMTQNEVFGSCLVKLDDHKVKTLKKWENPPTKRG